MQRITLSNFSLEAPEDWSLTTVILAGPVEEAPTQGMLTAKAGEPIQANLVVTMEQVGPSETPESYVKKQLEGLRQAQVQRRETAPPEKAKLADGSDAYLTEQAVAGPRNKQVRQLQMVTIRDGVAYTIIASNLDGLPYEKSKAKFRKMLLSLV